MQVGVTYSIAIILPIVGFFFVSFGLMEDSGYLPRLAVMLNRFFKIIGLNGKAVLPMVLGLGCDTMATMTTRILDTKKGEGNINFVACTCSTVFGTTGSNCWNSW